MTISSPKPQQNLVSEIVAQAGKKTFAAQPLNLG
jgi:hypothetical protein